jgi:hypothetical protein
MQGESAIDLTTARGPFGGAGSIGTIHSEGDQEEDHQMMTTIRNQVNDDPSPMVQRAS